MPELPEVVAYPAADEFCRLLTGQTVSHMTRRGKFLMIWLNSDDRMILHLRMTGCLLLTAEYLHTRLGKRKRAVKECLLDQSIIAGKRFAV